jgi:dihydropteroate synthase
MPHFLDLSRPRLMGVLNATPDSFSDGGRFLDPLAARDHGLRMAAEGADCIDVGGESTRPGAERVPAAEQARRVVPVIEALRASLPRAMPISIDTTRAEVAAAALDAGADLVNDVSAGRDDPQMLPLVAGRGVQIVLMHMQGEPASMQQDPRYTDVVAEVEAFLLARAGAAMGAGVPREAILLDPGIGFGKHLEHNLALLAALPRLATHGLPLLVGTSRKRMLRALCNCEPGTDLGAATAATTALGVTAGARVFRVHDVAANRQALDVAWAIHQAGIASTPGQ